jgi:hypothetical protein
VALSASTIWEVRTTGDDTNGGGFVSGASGTDWSQQAAAQYSVTDAVTNGTTTITSATANFGTDVVGHILYIQGGTAPITAGWYQIISRTNSTTIVVDRATGLTAGTGATLKIGGALLTIGRALTNHIDQNVIWVKAGTYSISTGLTFGAAASLPNVRPTCLLGYNATRGDNPTGANRPVISGTAAIVMLAITEGYRVFANFELDGTDTATKGLSFQRRGNQIANVKVHRTATYGLEGAGGPAIVFGVEVTDLKAGATAAFFGSNTWLISCWFHDSPGRGIYDNANSGGIVAINTIIEDMDGDAVDGGGLENSLYLGCSIHSNGSDGIIHQATYQALAVLFSILNENGAYGISTSLTELVARPTLDYNAFRSNSSGPRNNVVAGANDITLTADPFEDAANGDFNINDTAGGGTLLRAVTYTIPPG